jgi:hypothetical protein
VSIGEAPPFVGKPVDVRRRHLRRSVATDIAMAKIVGEDEDDVGF